MILTTIIGIAIALEQSDFTLAMVANSARDTLDYDTSAKAKEEFLSSNIQQSLRVFKPGESGNQLETGGYFAALRNTGGSFDWILDLRDSGPIEHRTFRDVVACNSTAFACLEHGPSGDGGQIYSIALASMTNGKPYWRWFPYEIAIYSNQSSAQRYGLVNNTLGERESLKYDDGSLLMPGYCPALSEEGLLRKGQLSRYFSLISDRLLRTGKSSAASPDLDLDFTSEVNVWRLMSLQEYDSKTVTARWGKEVDVICRAIKVLQEYTGRFVDAAKDRGIEKSLTGAEQKDLEATCNIQDVLEQQLSRVDAHSLLFAKFARGQQLLTKAFNFAIDKSLIPKSPKISEEFNPNTASLVRQALAAEKITQTQIRRVNACYLLDIMRSDLAFTVPTRDTLF